MFLNYYSTLSFLPVYLIEYINKIYSFCLLWVYQCYFEMLVSTDFNGLLIPKNPTKVILYLHSGFFEFTTTINDLSLCLDLSFQTEASLFSLEYNQNDFEKTLEELNKSYSWLKKKYKNVILVGQGIGCYIIQNWIINFNISKKLNLVFISPIVSLKIKQSYFESDILDFRSIRRSLDKIIYREDCDYNLFCSKIEKILFIIGRNDPFYLNSKKMTHFIKNNCEIDIKRHVINNCGHYFIHNNCQESINSLKK